VGASLSELRVGNSNFGYRDGRESRLGDHPVMKRDLDDLLKDALELPPEARAALAGSLIDSLDAKVDDDVEAAWDAEIARRIRDVDAGKVALSPWSEVRRSLVGQ
jgi:putative addiction module component (TIGR02574 family)